MKIEAKIIENKDAKDAKDSKDITKNICGLMRSFKSLLQTKSRAPHLTGTQKRKEIAKYRLSTLRRNKKSNKKEI